MASIKVKFRISIVENREGTLFYQLIHNRKIRQINTDYKIFPCEWNKYTSKIILPMYDENRKNYLLSLEEKIIWDTDRLTKIITSFDNKGGRYTTDNIVFCFENQLKETSFFIFIQEAIIRLKELGRLRTSETYKTTLNSFMKFRNDKDLFPSEINSRLICEYEAYLRSNSITLNSSSFYMRILRAVYNRTVEKGLTEQQYPFKYVYTGVEKTIKRAVTFNAIRQIKDLDLTLSPTLEYARDMFLFSFYTRGMSFVDMAYLKKKDLNEGVLSYRRKKTGQQLFIKWEKCMQNILNKYPTNDSSYLLPIIKSMKKDDRTQYKNASGVINRNLKIIGRTLKLPSPLTMYVARHSWASIARSKNIPISVISEGMGHDSEQTTQIYLASLSTSIIDKANEVIIRSLLQNNNV